MDANRMRTVTVLAATLVLLSLGQAAAVFAQPAAGERAATAERMRAVARTVLYGCHMATSRVGLGYLREAGAGTSADENRSEPRLIRLHFVRDEVLVARG